MRIKDLSSLTTVTVTLETYYTLSKGSVWFYHPCLFYWAMDGVLAFLPPLLSLFYK